MRQVEWNGRKWSWPDDDKFMLMVNDWALDFLQVLPLIKPQNGAIQAGGAVGLWPVLMSDHFRKVYTFEPHPDNFECLIENTKEIENITAYHAALGETDGTCEMARYPGERDNSGAWYTMPSEDGIPQVQLDKMAFDEPIDFIQLDIEGREAQVLRGAERIIKTYRPVIMVEEKRLLHDKAVGHTMGETAGYLAQFGYSIAMEIHRDIVFTSEPSLVAA